MGIIKGSIYFALGAASALAAQRLLQRYAKETGKEGADLLVQGVGTALKAGREMTRRAARFMEEVEDIVAEVQVKMDGAEAAAAQAAAPKEPAAPPTVPSA
jgi:hypothetical protein